MEKLKSQIKISNKDGKMYFKIKKYMKSIPMIINLLIFYRFFLIKLAK